MSQKKNPSSDLLDYHKLKPRSAAVRAGQNRALQETSEALFLTSGYAYDTAQQKADRFAGHDDGFIYSRFSNPTVQMFEHRLAAIEGAEFCRAVASGMAAVSSTMLSILSAGDHLVSSRALFGSCRYIISDLCTRMGIEVTFVDGTDLAAWQAAVRPATKLFFLETPSNPGLEIYDIAAIARIARAGGARLVVDNVFATPILQRPLALGADIVVYSATKHIDGQGRVLGGAILSNDGAVIDEELQPFIRHTGPAMSAFNAWVLVKSLETLPLRVEAMSRTASWLAEQLEELAQGHTGLSIRYPFLKTHPQRALAQAQMASGGTVLCMSFGGATPAEMQCRAFAFMDRLRLFDISNNLGDAKSLVTHPRTSTHSRLTEKQCREQGVEPGLVRLSIGLEDKEDIWDDIAHALAVCDTSF